MKKVIYVAPLVKSRYKGGINRIAEYLQAKDANDIFLENRIELEIFNSTRLNQKKNTEGKINFINILQAFNLLFSLSKRVFNRNFEIIHFNSSAKLPLLKDQLIIFFVSFLTSKKIVFQIHYCGITETFLENKWLKKIQFLLLMKTDMIILLSETFKRDLIKIGLPESKLNVLYNFHTLKNNIDINLKHDKSIINLLFIGSISERKGFKDIIEALKLVKINYRLNVLGEFPSESMRNYCKAQVLKNNLNIVFQGYISGEDKINFISNSDILILPSYEEGFPMVIPESMALGCAIIASNIAGIPEIVKENENGFLISPGQIDKLAEKIIWLHENKESLEMFKKNSLKLSGEYNIERYINKLSFLYNQEN